MKKVQFLFILLLFSVSKANCQKKEFIISNIQSQIERATAIDVKNKNNDSLSFIYKGLTILEKKKKHRVYTYWQAYTLLQISQNDYSNNRRDQAKKNLNNAISKVGSIKNKNADEYSLLALLQCVSMSFEPAGALWRLKDITENIESALKKEPQNIRANYVDAIFDFYTPEVYGGGEKVVSSLEKALEGSEQRFKNSYLPSWGKIESYELMIQYYLKKKNKNEANKYCEQALKKYPQNATFSKLWKKISNMN